MEGDFEKADNLCQGEKTTLWCVALIDNEKNKRENCCIGEDSIRESFEEQIEKMPKKNGKNSDLLKCALLYKKQNKKKDDNIVWVHDEV